MGFSRGISRLNERHIGVLDKHMEAYIHYVDGT